MNFGFLRYHVHNFINSKDKCQYKSDEGNTIYTQTGIGTAIAIAGVAVYSLIKANMEEQKRKAAAALAS
ncbi:unnamed protein product [Trifolium pratense]|uniref:Uncharacterized protein n=1 Tax=Trifolium pratense TaxID=57577 RepID=A0ACB0LUP8_TRIPR|nr:unnamed protein product [Trifolium pratense]